ncbi:TPA_asm: hypothetical protein GND55_004658 [Salmonella enterica subsp. salamae serovar 58:d:z6]|uniref:Uncharacterized protein n=1 Tax=Salmonella enterica subsp. salamae serovar 58:d:z6 TaxID=41517 RepID=A0A737STL3_SALER|nr:hypothetical protein [Salmonella enterica subsp. salamae serovar 58:d:z6]
MTEMYASLDIAFVDVRDVVNAANKDLYTGSDMAHPAMPDTFTGVCRWQ